MSVAADDESFWKSVFTSIICSIEINITNEPAEKSKQNGLGLSIRNDAKGIDMMIKTNPAAKSKANTPQFLLDSFYLNLIYAYLPLNPETKAPKSYSSSPKNYINNYPNLIKKFENL